MLLLWAVTALLRGRGLRENAGGLHTQINVLFASLYPWELGEGGRGSQVLTLNFALTASEIVRS